MERSHDERPLARAFTKAAILWSASNRRSMRSSRGALNGNASAERSVTELCRMRGRPRGQSRLLMARKRGRQEDARAHFRLALAPWQTPKQGDKETTWVLTSRGMQRLDAYKV